MLETHSVVSELVLQPKHGQLAIVMKPHKLQLLSYVLLAWQIFVCDVFITVGVAVQYCTV